MEKPEHVAQDSTLLGGPLPPSLSAVQSGMWRVVTERNSAGGKVLSFWDPCLAYLRSMCDLQYALYFLSDVYRAGPGIFALYVASNFLSGIDTGIRLYHTNRVLAEVEQAISTKKVNLDRILRTLAWSIFLELISATWQCLRSYADRTLAARVDLLCKVREMKAELRADLLSAQKPPNGRNYVPPSMRDNMLAHIFGMFDALSSLTSELILLLNLVKNQQHGYVFVILCLASPVLRRYTAGSAPLQNMIYYVTDSSYRRALAFYELALSHTARAEVISSGLQEYILAEHEKAIKGSGPMKSWQDAMPCEGSDPQLLSRCLLTLLEEIPLLFYILQVARNPSQDFSLTFLATLQQTTRNMAYTFYSISWSHSTLWAAVARAKALYAEPEPDSDNELHSGDAPYPPPDADPTEGMAIELQNVSYTYPGAPTPVLRAVSLTIAPSALVVVVGANGSGKTTLVRLLARHLAPGAGTLRVDGRAAHAYRARDLHAATALLAQEHALHAGLGVGENIALGDARAAHDTARVREAAGLGGADALVRGLPHGLAEDVVPVHTCVSMLAGGTGGGGALAEYRRGVERPRGLSGGEKQRLAASRTFMRLLGGRVRLLVVDEPSSALDPAAEHALFERLRAMRAGKTMVFVTHRFQHLTRHADLILCMKDGELVETGTHTELMARDGEYSKLYGIQARAFAGEDQSARA
ncbi:lipid A export ATP-binding/permease protein MsbA [Phanerochaete sordida]|uniref:Lipid A export ATP-binding/permease protein MsbA n=1 Tax=Phanerochaete sordida TaxID=48140 RepID=A0A9P3LA17_9APHY|nr:lipid A export ATP-binding/permease protein MsbA [Phanerochaete sordida]